MSVILLKRQLDALLKQQERAIEAIGDKIRKQVIVPACHKHGLRFSSGGGSFDFVQLGPPRESYGNDDDIRFSRHLTAAAKKDIRDILNLLHEDVWGKHSLGMYVESYNPGP